MRQSRRALAEAAVAVEAADEIRDEGLGFRLGLWIPAGSQQDREIEP